MIRLLGHYRTVTRHKCLVARFLLALAARLAWRALCHDLSKYTPAEARGFARSGLQGHVFGSAEYKAARLALGPALALHYRANRHHPEHFAALVSLVGQISQALKPGRAIYICCSSFNTDMVRALFKLHLHREPKYLVWDKGHFVLRRNDYHSQYELIAYGWMPGGGIADRWFGDRKQRDIWRARIPSGPARVHPTQKPLDLPLTAIRNSSPEGGTVLDPFLGSGTTLLAAEKLGRRCFGMELDHSMCDVVLARWEAESGRKAELVERLSEC